MARDVNLRFNHDIGEVVLNPEGQYVGILELAMIERWARGQLEARTGMNVDQFYDGMRELLAPDHAELEQAFDAALGEGRR